MKTCSSKTCKQTNPQFLDNFSKQASKRDGLTSQCTHCISTHKKAYYVANKQKLLSKIRQRYKTQYTECRKTMNTYHRLKMNTDSLYKIRHRLRTRIYNVMKNNGNRKTNSAVKNLGCSIKELRQHLESKFQVGMTWNNHGEWHVDHIKPLSSFNLTDPEQFKQACHYKNLQPLWAIDNLKKSDKT